MTLDKTFRLYNTLSNSVEPVETIEPGVLRFYSCGPTVYSHAHIGNFRTFLTADLIVRAARSLKWETRYVSNITDVGHLTEDDIADSSGEDKMALALQSERGHSFANVWDLARFYASELQHDWASLNLLEPDVRPRATEHIAQQVRTIEALVAGGHAYETNSGVYFSVESFENYGRLSGNIAADELAGASRDLVVDEEKRDKRDFALWKKDPKHLMQWYSPWGWGFPGWHLECSVMAIEYLGNTIDIHGGGEDLIFPHHECEIAQAESITGEPFANLWVHTRFLQVEGEKMSKSKGNFFTVHDLIASQDEGGRGIDPQVLRLTLISGHYRKPFNFTFETLRANARHIDRLKQARQIADADASGDAHDDLAGAVNRASEKMHVAMLDDLNTPEAIAAMIEGSRLITAAGQLNGVEKEAATAFLDLTDLLLGVSSGAEQDQPNAIEDRFAEEVEELLVERADARKAKDFERADEIRAKLTAMGVEVMDSAEGPTWRRVSII